MYEFIERFPVKDQEKLQKRLEKLLKELKVEPKNLEYYRKQLNSSEMLMREVRTLEVNEARPMAPRRGR